MPYILRKVANNFNTLLQKIDNWPSNQMWPIFANNSRLCVFWEYIILVLDIDMAALPYYVQQEKHILYSFLTVKDSIQK